MVENTLSFEPCKVSTTTMGLVMLLHVNPPVISLVNVNIPGETGPWNALPKY